MRTPRSWSTGAAVAVALVACSCSGPKEPTPSAAPSGGGQGGSVVEQARAGAASTEQVAILERSGDEVAFEDYQAAIGRTIVCMRDQGIDVIGDEVTQSRGFPEIRYSFSGSSAGRTDDQTLALADGCADTHSRWVDMVYQTSPRNVAARESQLDPYRAELTACITKNGGTVEDAATVDDLMVASSDVLDSSGVDCWRTVGAPR